MFIEHNMIVSLLSTQLVMFTAATVHVAVHRYSDNGPGEKAEYVTIKMNNIAAHTSRKNILTRYIKRLYNINIDILLGKKANEQTINKSRLTECLLRGLQIALALEITYVLQHVSLDQQFPTQM